MIGNLTSNVAVQTIATTVAHLVSTDIKPKNYGNAAAVGVIAGIAQFALQPAIYVVSRTLRLSDFMIHLINAASKAAITFVAFGALAGLTNPVGLGVFVGVNAISILHSLSQAVAKFNTGDSTIINDSTKAWFSPV